MYQSALLVILLQGPLLNSYFWLKAKGMLRKYLFPGLFALVCLVLLGLVFLKRSPQVKTPESHEALPGDALLFIEDVDYEYLVETFLPGNRMWQDFIHTSGRSGLDSSLRVLNGRIADRDDLRDLLTREGFSLSLHLIGKKQIAPLFFLPYEGAFSDNDFSSIMAAVLVEGADRVSRKYETEIIYEIPEGEISYACVNGLCLLSPSSMLVESAIRTLHSPDSQGTEGNEDMQRIRTTAGRYVHANIYINYSRVNMLFYPFLEEDHWSLPASLSKLAGIGELDLDIKEDALLFNGMSQAAGSEGHFLACLAGQNPVRMELHEIMPAGTYRFLHLGVSDPDSFLGGIRAYYTHSGEWEKMEQVLERVRQEYGVDLQGDLLRIMDNELALFSMDDGSPDRGEELLMIETNSRSETMEVCGRWVEMYLQKHSYDMESYRQVFRLDDQTRYPIFRIPDFDPEGVFPGNFFGHWFTVYENYLIIGPSVELISRVIYQNVLHKTFASDPVYKEVSDYFSNRSNLSFFVRPSAALEAARELLSSNAAEVLASLELFIRRIPGLVIQYSSEGDLFYQGAALRYTSQIREKALTVWESMLDSVAGMKPALVVNHDTREKEIFVQDAANGIYLVNGTGRILWKQQLEGPILGEVHQVDYYRNGKLQFLFNTSSRLHLIDRNGNPVERYPLSLPSPATAPLGLFNYDKSRDYRICIPGEDRRIRLYDLMGKQISGWKFGTTESLVINAPQHLRIGDRDYLVIKNHTRAYFLDRRGRERIKPERRVVYSPQNAFFVDMNIQENRPRLISSDTSGNVVAMTEDGKLEILLRQDLHASHYFQMTDLDADGISDFLFADGGELNLIRQDGSRLFSFRVKDRVGAMPDIYKFSSTDIKIGICDTGRSRIYLINADGSLYDGFPLEGTTRFSIGYFAGSDSRFNLIVGGNNNFLYNYSIK